jgi:hypothetical protein
MSTAAKSAERVTLRPVAAASGLAANAPSILLPLRFVLCGFLALGFGVALLAWRPDLLATYHYNQYIIATTHLFVLGWIATIVMGAVYQLVPVALETKLYSERLARWQFILHVIGFAGMVWMFWVWNMKQVGHFGSVLALGVGLFVYNLVRTLWRVPRWNSIASTVALALGWLSLTILAGLILASAKSTFEPTTPQAYGGFVAWMIDGLKAFARLAARFDAIRAMHAHAHLGVVGVFLLLIVGVSYKLIPMFTLSEIQSYWRVRLSLILLNLGLVVAFVTILIGSRAKPVSALLLAAGLAFYAVELAAILRARKRPVLDWGLKYFLTAVGLLLPVSLLGLVLSWPALPLNVLTGQLENLYGFIMLMGVVSFAILGMLQKILPFIVWYTAYSPRIGLAKVPSLADLGSPRFQAAGYWLYVAGLALTSVAIVLGRPEPVRLGCLLLGSSLVAVAVNFAKVLSHLSRSQTAPSLVVPLPRSAAAAK